MSTKSTAKSCNCRQCTWSKRKPGGQLRIKHAERAFRHRANLEAKLGVDGMLPAPRSDR